VWLAQWVALLPAAVVMGGGWLSVCEAQKKSGSKSEKTSIYFTDSRNGQKYRAVKVGGKTWMAENLNYQTGNSWCYEDANSSCNKYGRLYTWNAAKTACPSGWRLPSHQDWNDLVPAAGGVSVAGKKLKASSGWNENGNGTDKYGFSALPGGYRYTDGNFNYVGNYGGWWTATATESDDHFAFYQHIFYNDDSMLNGYVNKEDGLSVRCVGD
jgi:uncharacterized protein (TIGR02145 family)